MNDTDIARLAAGRHHDPHAVLGAHQDGKELVIRTLRPDALTVRVFGKGKPLTELLPMHSAGVFEGRVPAAAVDTFLGGYDYELEVTYAGNQTFRLRDAYAFSPTLGEMDTHLWNEGNHRRIYERLGARPRNIGGVDGTSFAVWAPNAKAVRVVGDWNSWDGRLHPMRSMGASGVWEIFVPGVAAGAKYKYELIGADEQLVLKTDPFAFQCEHPPANACVVHESNYTFGDDVWMERRAESKPHELPLSIYEVHLGSWRRTPAGDVLSYTDLAEQLADYCRDMGFTHVELLPIAEHPFTGSWGYQVTNYYAPTSRFGSPDDFRAFVDILHRAGIGVLVDWVPAHFPKDAWALGRYDGSALFEHLDPRKGEHPDWGTFIFNYGRNEVRNFLVANALYWMREFHIDGLRVDAVASMLYLDYSRKAGEWVPNAYGGRENVDAIAFMRELNTVVHAEFPGILMIAEESTAWGGVSRPVETGGLGFGFKWNMGWMHDSLSYIEKDPIHRKYHHDQLTFGLLYAFTENFVLPISHDEVVHGKGSLVSKMPGDRWQQLANLRAYLAFMWSHPGKQVLFMGCEFAQSEEWNAEKSLDWHLTEYDEHKGVQQLVRDLNRVYREHPALWQRDFTPDGFRWIEGGDANQNVLSFVRYGKDGTPPLVCVANFSPEIRHGYRIGVPSAGTYREVLNSDARAYGGHDVGNAGRVTSDPIPSHGFEHSISITIPPLGVLWLKR